MMMNLLKSKEESARPHNEEECQIEDAFLTGHHNAPVATERIPSWQLLPFPRHFLSCYQHRHGCTFTEGGVTQ